MQEAIDIVSSNKTLRRKNEKKKIEKLKFE